METKRLIPADVEAEAKNVATTILPLLRSGDDLKWQIGEVLVDWHKSDAAHWIHNNGSTPVAAIARILTTQGHEVSDSTLKSYYVTAKAFAPSDRRDDVAFSTHRVVAETGDAEGAAARMTGMLNAFAANGTTSSQRNALAYFGRTSYGGASEKSVTDFIARHPEVVTRVVQENPQVAEAARTGLETPAPVVEDDVPVRPVRQLPPPVVNRSLTHITLMEQSLRSLHSTVPYLRNEAERNEVLERVQGLIDGLQECIARTDTGWQAA